MKFLYLSDCHIKSRTWTNNMKLRGDAYQALCGISYNLQDSTIDTAVIGGDWFDSNHPSSEDLIETKAFFQSFKHVYYISGNHDSVDPSYLEAMNGLHQDSYDDDDDALPLFVRLSQMPMHMEGTKNTYIAGVSWTASESELKDSISAICTTWKNMCQPDAVLYVVLHTSFQHLLGFDGAYKLDADFVSRLIGDMSIRILVGDIHVRNTLQLNENVSYIHSSGSLYPLSFDKAVDVPYAMSLITDDTGAIQDVPCKVRNYYSHVYVDETELAEFCRVCAAENTYVLDPFVRLIVPDDKDVHIVESAYPEIILQVQKASDASEQSSLHASAMTSDTYTFLQAVTDEIGESTADAELQSSLAGALLTSADPLATVEDWLNYWKVARGD